MRTIQLMIIMRMSNNNIINNTLLIINNMTTISTFNNNTIHRNKRSPMSMINKMHNHQCLNCQINKQTTLTTISTWTQINSKCSCKTILK